MKHSILSAMMMIVIIAVFSPGNANATKHIITVQNFSFNPASITDVSVGDTMRWEWVSGSHTTTSTTIPATAATWDHPLNSANTSFEYKVTVSGTYNYKCTPHAVSMGMVGSFIATGSTPTLTVLPGNQNVTAVAGSTSFSVTSNSNWTTVSDKDWCSLTPSGTGNGIITATYTVNPTNAIRVASAMINVPGLEPVMVTVTQDLSHVSVIENPGKNFRIYPNPTNGKFTVSMGDNYNKPARIAVLNAIGKEVYTQIADGAENYYFDLASLARGSYFVRVISEEGVKVNKLVLIK
jgi:plastocyanin